MSDNGRKVLVDSNVWLYIFLPGQDDVKSQVATQLVAEHAQNIVVSTQVINETVRNIRYNQVMSELRIRDLVNSFYQDYPVIQMNQDIQLRASFLREKYSISYWDSLLASAGLEIQAEILLSEDMQDGLVIDEQMTIVNPFVAR